MKLNKQQKRILIVLGTIVGLAALFFTIVFIPLGSDEEKLDALNSDEVVETEITEVDDLSKEELKERVKELEAENKELKEEVEKYKILAEDSTQSVTITENEKKSTSESEKKVDKNNVEYTDSSHYYDENYTDYITDDNTSESDNSSQGGENGTGEVVTNPDGSYSGSNVIDPNLSDTGL